MKKKLIAIFLIATIGIVIGCMGAGGGLGGGATNSGGGTNATAGGTTATAGGGGSTVAVTMSGMTFSPQVVNAHPGDTVQWTNTGSLPHTVNSDTGVTDFDSSGQFPAGIGLNGVFTWTVPAGATVGTHYFYHCNFHGLAGDGTTFGQGMSGEITVN